MPISGPTTDHKEIRSWGNRHHMLPTEVLPQLVDHEPSMLQLMPVRMVRGRKDLRVIGWEEFFARFDLLGLAFVYDEDDTDYNELLQRDEKTPHIGQAYRVERHHN